VKIVEEPDSRTTPRSHLRRPLRVPFHHADPTGSASIVALAGYMQQAAGEHAEQLGVGAKHLARDGVFWVLTRLYLRIERAPRGGETIEIDTWPSQRPRHLYLRDFRVYGEDGAVIIEAASSWALIDAARRKAVKGPSWITDHVAFDVARAAVFPDKAPMRLEREERAVDMTPRWSDIDINGHVNNAVLIGWLLEAFSSDWLADHALSALDVAFRAECRRDDEVSSAITRIVGENFGHSVKRGDGAACVRAQSWWRTSNR